MACLTDEESNNIENQQHEDEVKKESKISSEIVYDKEVVADYEMGMSKMNSTQGDKDFRGAYFYLNKAAEKGHLKAKEEMAIAMLIGDHVQRNITGAKQVFENLSTTQGSPRSQFYMGLLYASGLGVKSNQAKALTYFTFSALGEDNLAQMALGYRYWSSINVENDCELALNYYRKIATSVANRVSSNSVGTINCWQIVVTYRRNTASDCCIIRALEVSTCSMIRRCIILRGRPRRATIMPWPIWESFIWRGDPM